MREVQNGKEFVPLLKPDPTFYPSPRLAMQAPPEKHAFVAALNSPGSELNDALLVVDVDPESSTYGQRVGEVKMPEFGDELHHFGWKAFTSALLGRPMVAVQEVFSCSIVKRSRFWVSGK